MGSTQAALDGVKLIEVATVAGYPAPVIEFPDGVNRPVRTSADSNRKELLAKIEAVRDCSIVNVVCYSQPWELSDGSASGVIWRLLDISKGE